MQIFYVQGFMHKLVYLKHFYKIKVYIRSQVCAGTRPNLPHCRILTKLLPLHLVQLPNYTFQHQLSVTDPWHQLVTIRSITAGIWTNTLKVHFIIVCRRFQMKNLKVHEFDWLQSIRQLPECALNCLSCNSEITISRILKCQVLEYTFHSQGFQRGSLVFSYRYPNWLTAIVFHILIILLTLGPWCRRCRKIV